MPNVASHGADWVPGNMPYGVFRQQGLKFAMRYVVPSIPGKMITSEEVRNAHSWGVDLGFIYETTGRTWDGGYDAGVRDGVAAASALRTLGAPQSCAAYHAVDMQVGQAVIGTVMDWVRGLITGMRPYRTGLYGQLLVVDYAAAIYPQVFRWQTEAWSSGQISPNADMLQLGSASIAGIDTDVDVAYVPHFGQWYANPSQQPPALHGDDMISGELTPVDIVGYPFPEGSATTVSLYTDTGLVADEPQSVRVALFSKAKGYSQIETVELHTAAPFSMLMQEHDVCAVSFKRTTADGNHVIGFSVS